MSPDLQNLFISAGQQTDDHESMKKEEHSCKVMESLNNCLNLIHDFPKLKEELITLGVAHCIKGVTSEQFAVSF